MQPTKRLSFLIVLIAFLGNLALGMTLPVVGEFSFLGAKEPSKQLHLTQKAKSSTYVVVHEEIEEVEEVETDTEFDATLYPQDYSVSYFQFLKPLYTSVSDLTNFSNKPGAYRNWLWGKQQIFIYFQVFRI